MIISVYNFYYVQCTHEYFYLYILSIYSHIHQKMFHYPIRREGIGKIQFNDDEQI